MAWEENRWVAAEILDSPERVEDPDWPVVWPHEFVVEGAPDDAVPAPDPIRYSLINAGLKTGTIILQGIVGYDREPAAQLARQMDTMGRLNGPGSEVLADKVQFVEIVRRLGYLAPRQETVPKGSDYETAVETLATTFPDATERIICKPVGGYNSRGVLELDAGDAPEALSYQDRSYIVQNHMPIEGEIRYIRQVYGPDGVIQRYYFDESDVPKIIGDGTKTIEELIRGTGVSGVPLKETLRRNKDDLGIVLPEGHARHMAFRNFPQPGEAPRVPDWDPQNAHRVENVDQFMKRFLGDLQTAIGHPLPYLCFDLGIMNMDVLDKPYDFEAMKQNVVPFECQMPFLVLGYLKRGVTSISDRWALHKIMWSRMDQGKYADFIGQS